MPPVFACGVLAACGSCLRVGPLLSVTAGSLFQSELPGAYSMPLNCNLLLVRDVQLCMRSALALQVVLHLACCD